MFIEVLILLYYYLLAINLYNVINDTRNNDICYFVAIQNYYSCVLNTFIGMYNV